MDVNGKKARGLVIYLIDQTFVISLSVVGVRTVLIWSDKILSIKVVKLAAEIKEQL